MKSVETETRVPNGVSVILPVLNEELYLANAVQAVLSQDYLGNLEVILAVGPSTDRTEAIARELSEGDSRVVVIESPTGRTAAGLNLAVKASSYSIIVRVDGHAEIPRDYISLAVAIMTETGAVNVGGVMAADGRTPFERAVALAMRSPLGVGASRFHTGGSAGPVDTVYLGVFQRDALIAAGGFDERFTRAQDWELNYRLRAMGGVVYFDPRLFVTYRPRPNLKTLAKQYFEYGRWRHAVIRRHQGTVNLRYLAPPVAFIGIALSILFGILFSPCWFIPTFVYLIFILLASALIGRKVADYLRLPWILITMHMSWGVGYLLSPRSLMPSE